MTKELWKYSILELLKGYKEKKKAPPTEVAKKL